MKRKLLLALIALTCALCLIFALAGCNPAANQSGDQQETPGGQGGEQGGNSDNEKPDTHNYIFKCSQTEHWQACTDCGEETAHTPHSVSDGVCPACGYVEKCTEGLEFTEIEENEKTVGYSVSKGTATDSHIFIPSFYNNLPVLLIGYEAFYNCTSLTEITVGNNVISIDEGAFWCCESLTKITIPDSVTSIGNGAFDWCTSLTELTIPNRITSIGYYAFVHCESLKEINIPDSVTSIGECAFLNCESLKEITIPNSVTSIGGGAFQGCTSLENITIPEGVTSIGERAFSYCESLESITVDKDNKVYRSEGNCLIEIDTKTVILGCKTSKIPDGVTSIGDDAFEGCTSITEINIPNSVTSIGNYAFLHCESLTEITIGNGVTSIGERPFLGCTSLESITIDKENKVYRSEDNCIIETETKAVILGCKTSKIPEGITSIGNQAFDSCTNLTEITIPASVIFIGDYAFSGCENLEMVNFRNHSNLTSIGVAAFSSCVSLTEITIGNNVTSIGERAFFGCESLERVSFENTSDWKVSHYSDMSYSEEINVEDPEQNANNLKGWYYWKRGE